MHNLLLESIIHENVKTHEVFAKPGLMWWQWGLIILLTCIVLFTLRLLLKLKKPRARKTTSPIQAFDAALSGLNEELSPPEFAISISKMIRHYLHDSQLSEAIFQTNEEINRSSIKVSEATQLTLVEFLNSLEELKYGNIYAKSVNRNTIVKSAHDLIHTVEKEITQPAPVVTG